jgi:hypothetical protein
MKNLRAGPSSKTGWWVVGLIAVILVAMFWRSFLSDYVFFSNDGPLGVQNAAWLRMPDAITGMWPDLNYLGNNGGAATPSITVLLRWLLPPLAIAKFYSMIALFILGVSAWTLFQQLRLTPLAAALGALAMVLNSTFFSTACWGVAAQEIAVGMNCLALALIVGCTPATPRLIRGTRLVLAGLCVGMNVMEAADIGALYSMLVALFVFFHALVTEDGVPVQRALRGVGRVAVVAAFAGLIGFQAVLSLLGIAVTGMAGTAQDTETKAAHWDWATQWSLPKAETFGLLVPGLFGYKMDTPKDMQPSLTNAYDNGVYWGGAGRDPAIDRWLDAGAQGNQPPGFMRFTGGGNYCGILVLLVAGWTIAQSLRRQNSVFPNLQKRMVQFWAAILLLCLLFSWGRFAPFYAVLYRLPYFSTIRNPSKFLIFFSWALVIIFAYGIHGLNRRYLDAQAAPGAGLKTQLKSWWAKISRFDRNWTQITVGLVGASVVGWLIYANQAPALIQYLHKVGFGGDDPRAENSAAAIAQFSVGQAGWFLVLFAIAVALVLLVICGYFTGPRAKAGALLLGGFLLFDMCRANLPWVVDWDYKQKYEVGSLNPIVKYLVDKPYENRVFELPFRVPEGMELFDELYRIEWVQHLFPYYNIQSLDIVQMPRMPEDIQAFKGALAPRGDAASAPLIAREWQLTNTRYLLGPAGYLEVMNQQLDPEQHRFRILQRFEVVPKPGITEPKRLEELTAVPDPNGRYALFEFTGALPRAKVYSSWQVNTNDQALLKTLADLNFDPAKTVLISTPENGLAPAATNVNSGTVEFRSYAPAHIVFSAQTTGPAVLLLNDRYDPQWQIIVDGQPAELLRCNFIVQGVYLPTAGPHTVDFRFLLPHRPMYVTLAAIALGLGLCGFLFYSTRRASARTAV